MRELVDEMLLLAALDRGQAALSEGDCDASAVAERVVASRVVRARQSGMTLRIDAAAGLRVPIGEQLLEVVIGNVVDNALKYAGSGAEVEVGVRGRAGEVEIAVSDTGVGIAPEHLPHVFERFFRGEQARSSPGSGLGLAVVKHIVEAHGGRARRRAERGGRRRAPRAPRGLRRQRVVTATRSSAAGGGLGRVHRLLEPVVQRLRADDLERLGARGEQPRERIAHELVALVLERVEVGDLGLEVRRRRRRSTASASRSLACRTSRAWARARSGTDWTPTSSSSVEASSTASQTSSSARASASRCSRGIGVAKVRCSAA